MNERYLFRGKRIDNGEWVYGSLAQTNNYPYDGTNISSYIWEIPCVETLKPVNSSTIGQCTGARDKNGTLIFEGDILRHYKYKNLNSDVVAWDKKANGGMGGWSMFHPLNEFEISGNIHEVPLGIGEE